MRDDLGFESSAASEPPGRLSVDLLQCNEKGLTTEEFKHRLEQYGPNKLPESKRIPILVFLGYMWNPLSWAMEAAAIASIALLDYVDFVLILSLLLCNASIRCVLATAVLVLNCAWESVT